MACTNPLDSRALKITPPKDLGARLENINESFKANSPEEQAELDSIDNQEMPIGQALTEIFRCYSRIYDRIMNRIKPERKRQYTDK